MARNFKKQGKRSPLADYIRPAIDAKYATQIEAAEDIGVSQSQLSVIMNRKSPAISEAVIARICSKLGLDKKEGVSRLSRAREEKIRKRGQKN